VAAMGLASTALMHDWLSWNTALWDLGRRAVSRSIDPLAIEGGMEWDGWHQATRQPPQRRHWRDVFSPLAIRQKAGPVKGLTLEATRVWFPQVSGRFALSFSPRKDAVGIDSEPYRLWLLPGDHRIYLLRYVPTDAPGRTATVRP
jgi:hypothetical protein